VKRFARGGFPADPQLLADFGKREPTEEPQVEDLAMVRRQTEERPLDDILHFLAGDDLARGRPFSGEDRGKQHIAFAIPESNDSACASFSGARSSG
jgi:hypothetical protein